MSLAFNADEIFEIAQQVERNGAAFYRMAADVFDDSPVKDRLLTFAAMEDRHEKTFAAMREKFVGADAESFVYDPDSQAALYLQAVAAGKVFDLDDDPAVMFEEDPAIEDVLMEAIELEKDSIILYTGLREIVSGEADKNAVNEIILQEMGHVNDLLHELEAVIQDME